MKSIHTDGNEFITEASRMLTSLKLTLDFKSLYGNKYMLPRNQETSCLDRNCLEATIPRQLCKRLPPPRRPRGSPEVPRRCYLLEEAVLLVGDGRGRLRVLAALLPQARPHVLLLQQRVELRKGVQDLLEQNALSECSGRKSVCPQQADFTAPRLPPPGRCSSGPVNRAGAASPAGVE